MSSQETTQSKHEINFQELEKPIQDIITLTNKLDEKYREKCFEILLNFYLMGRTGSLSVAPAKQELEKKERLPDRSFEVPIDVRAFLTQQNIPEDVIKKLFLIDKGEIRPIYKISAAKKAEGQIQIALLAALENAIRAPSNKFEFSVEDVRTRCQKMNIYDAGNFTANFKNSARLFNGLDEKEHVGLSPDGQTELAETITHVAK